MKAESLTEVIAEMENENHGMMSKDTWDKMKDKYLEIQKEIDSPSTLVKPKSTLILP